MKKSLLTLVVALMLSACGAGKFLVKEPDTRFNESTNPVYVSENNRISSKSIAGGIHIDSKGVYVNPFVEKDSAGQVSLLGFNILNKTDFDTTMGGVNQLGVLQEVVFRLPSGELIALDVSNQENRSSDRITFNTVSRSAGYDKWESGLVTISKEDFARLAAAERVSAKITGSRGNPPGH